MYYLCTECVFVTLVGFVFDASLILWSWVLFVALLTVCFIVGIEKIGLFMCCFDEFVMVD